MDPVGHYDHPVRREFRESRQFLALYRQRGCAPFRRKRKGHKMNDYVVIIYDGEQVSAPKEVADFFWQDRKRQQAQEKQDARHLSKSEFETVPSGSDCVRRPVEDAALRNLQLENLRKAIAELDVQGQNLLSLRYSDALTMDEIGQIYGISKMAVSKRLKKLHEKLGSSFS